MILKILSPQEKKEVEKYLNEQFGISEIDGTIIQIGAERLFLFQGSLNEKQIKKLEELVQIERVGVYFAKYQDGKIRLSIEGTHLFENQIKKNIFEIPNEFVEPWMKGNELNIKTGKVGFLVMKHDEDLLGTGKSSEEKITNFIPKNRRLKERN